MEIFLAELYPELPGASQLPPPPRELFEKARQRRGADYRPRTRHLRPDGFARYTNRLFLESSPYLLQHAHNPVNWFPWGNEAFEVAARLERPLLISIGYATCHWCHVMEEESFENEEVARYLNENFVAVKVDREERPDLDSVYMSALHAMGMQGGWPLNVFVAPDRRPFYGGTYFPPYDHGRGIGFLSLLKRLREAYGREPEKIAEAGRQLAEAVRGMLVPAEREGELQRRSLELAAEIYRERFDQVNGGIAGAPKFPSSLPVRLLLRAHRGGDREPVSMAQVTLRKMAAGGIYDQVGGGFHRYATDESWLIPHFEKMLYDNALLAVTYLEGYQRLGEPELAAVVREVLRYLRRDLASPAGAFYAATDADSLTPEGLREEGYFFTWTREEIAQALGTDHGEVVGLYYGVTRTGNFEGRNIPHRARSVAEVARETGLGEERVRAIVAESRERLYEVRNGRPRPLRDEKILCSWNGLAVSAFARAGLVLNDAEAIEQASTAARFVLDDMVAEGRLAHSHQGGDPKGEGFLDDYAFFIAGLIDLFEASGDARWLARSMELAAVVAREFEDRERGGFFMTGSRHEELIAREKPYYDGVVPSGNSVMVMNLLRLHGLTEEPRYLESATRALQCFSAQLSSAPTAVTEMLLALDFLLDVPRQVVIVAPRGDRQAAQTLLARLNAVYIPNRTLVVVCEGEELDRASALVPLLRGKRANGEMAVAYLCENRSCRLPTSDAEEFDRQLREIAAR